MITNENPVVSKKPQRTGKPHPKVKFSPEEDFHLRTIIMNFGDHDWNLISSLMKDRNPRQCRERWFKYLAPNVRFEPWTLEEDNQLERLVKEFGQKWVKISRFFRNRTDINVKNRWLVLQRQKAKSNFNKNENNETESSLTPITPNKSSFNQLPMPILSFSKEIDPLMDLGEMTPKFDTEIWEDFIHVPVVEFETPLDIFSVPW